MKKKTKHINIPNEFSGIEFVPFQDGKRAAFEFPNGYGASLVQHSGSYGGRNGQYELAVIRNNRLCYKTPITKDVLGFLDEEDVMTYLHEIEGLPALD